MQPKEKQSNHADDGDAKTNTVPEHATHKPSKVRLDHLEAVLRMLEDPPTGLRERYETMRDELIEAHDPHSFDYTLAMRKENATGGPLGAMLGGAEYIRALEAHIMVLDLRARKAKGAKA